MSYQGYLLKVDGVVFPNNLISHGSFVITPDQSQDLDSYRDQIGKLKRNVLPHKPTKIEFTTKMMHENEKQLFKEIMKNRDEYQLEYLDGEYKTGTFYSPPFEFKVYDINEVTGDIRYMPFRVAMVEY